MRILKGVVPVLITPLEENCEIDVLSLAKLVNYLNSKNIGGLWVLGTGGEDMNLTFKQRLLVAEVVSETNAGESPLILGTGFYAWQDTLDFINETKYLNIDAYHYMPYHPLLSLDRISWIYKNLCDIASKPMWMYTSANWARNIPPSFVQEMKGFPNLAGIKFSTSNIVDVEKVIRIADDSFQVITAVVRTFYSCLILGVKAGTTVEACPFADPIIKIYEDFYTGRHESSLNAQISLNKLLDKMPKGPGLDNFLKVAEGKYILSKKDICKEYMSGYYRTLNDEEKREVDEIIT